MAGRPSKYETHVKPRLIEVEAWCRDGLTKEQIAQKLGIHIATLCEYQNKYIEFSEALKRGREVADIVIENALFKRALGYKYKEAKKESYQVEGSDRVAIKEVEIIKEVPGDTTAQIFWLKNRRPELWNDRRIVENTGTLDINNKHDFSNLSKEELKELLKEE